MKSTIVLACLLLVFSCNRERALESNSNEARSEGLIDRIEPPNWWIGLKNEKLQLLVHHPNIGNSTPTISYSGVTLESVHKADSPNYLFLDLILSNTVKAGTFDITFRFQDETELKVSYELKERQIPSEEFNGFDSSDVVYLITPDRFANGDESNDVFPNLKEKTINRDDDYARHGGDIKGIIDHLDYIDQLGFTAIWSSPLLLNDMPQGSYHGYAITDYYKVDPRFGTLTEYIQLSHNMKEKGMKLIMDQVANHCGLEHWWMKDLPFKDWINYQELYEANQDDWNWKITKHSNHRRTTNQDPYASTSDHDEMSKGWFVKDMPDLNQVNPFMANYIIQNSLWWIETLQLGGIRQDTYPYPDKEFMSDWANAIMTEYPNFNIVGEEWSYNPLLIGYWQDNSTNTDGYRSYLKSTMDFAMQSRIIDALNEEESWDKGLVKIYEGLANDFAYENPKKRESAQWALRIFQP